MCLGDAMASCVIVRHGEIFTKSEPVRRIFVDRLVRNIRQMLPGRRVINAKWRVFVFPKDDADEERVLDALSRVFGVVSFSPCIESSPDIGSLKKDGLALVKPLMKHSETFAVKTQRLTKQGPTSLDINIAVGAHIKDATGAKVDLGSPGVCLGIEIYAGHAYLFAQSLAGPGGLPLGTAGKVIALVDDKYSVMAAWMMMKRGATVFPSIEGQKAKKAFGILGKWGYSQTDDSDALAVVSGVRDVKEMLRIAAGFNVPLFAPLIGLDKKSIASLEKKVFA